MAEILLGGKRLSELKVAELKVELEKRGLPKKGVKSVLIGRLKNAILREELTQVSTKLSTILAPCEWWNTTAAVAHANVLTSLMAILFLCTG